MKSRRTERFRRAFEKLPESVQKQTREAYVLFEQDPSHPSLRFKKVHPSRPIYSARVSQQYRALGVLADDEIIWFWIGSHDEYENLLARL